MSGTNLVGMLPSELEDLAVEFGASRYRGRQLATWMYRKGVFSLDAMSDLPKDFRTAIYLADIEGYPYREVARIMGTPIGTVMSRLHRGRERLRCALAGYGPQGRSATAMA